MLDVYKDKVVLTQIQNFRAMVTHDFFKGDKVIPFISMTSIQFKEASSMILGYIQFEVPGVNSRDNFGSENSWTFYEKDNAIAKEVCEYCRQRIMDIKSPAPAPAPAPVPVAPAPSSNNFSVADEIRKLKQLLDEGIITQEEFDEQKRKLLNK